MITWMIWSTCLSALLAAAAVALDRAVGVLGGSRRHIWLAALLIGAGLPVFLAVQQQRPITELATRPLAADAPATSARPIEPVRFSPSIQSAAAADADPGVTVVHVVPSDQPTPLRRVLARAEVGAAAAVGWVVILWVVSSLVVLVVFVRTMRALARRSTIWREADIGTCRALISPHEGPAVIGFVRPRIVLPAWALSLDPPSRDLMLRHEQEHIRGGDPRLLLAAGIVLVALPWNVGLWWIAKRLRFAMELDCDARVLRAIGAPRDYALMLVAVGERHIRPMPLAASLVEPPLLLERRIAAILARRPRHPVIASLVVAGVAALVMIAVPMFPRPEPLRTSARRDEARPIVVPVAPSRLADAAPAPMLAPQRHASVARSAPTTARVVSPPTGLSPIMRRLIMTAGIDASRARRGLPWAETAIADYQDALAETIRDPTQAPQRDWVYESLGRFALDEVKATADSATKQRYLAVAMDAFRHRPSDPVDLTKAEMLSGDSASVTASYQTTLANPNATYLELIKAGFAADIAAQAGLGEARGAELELTRRARAATPAGSRKLYTLSVALDADSGSLTRPLLDRLMIVDPSSVTKTEALHGVYAMLQIGAAYEGDRYTNMADAARQQSDTISSRAYSDSAHAWDDSSKVLDKEYNDFLSTADSALVGVKVTSWMPKRASIQIAGAMINRTTAPKTGRMHVEFLNSAAQAVSTADVPFTLDPNGTEEFTATGTGAGIVAFRCVLPR